MSAQNLSQAPPQPPKHSRILACVLCQHRKIKCDRNFPCSHCVKANVTCTPSVPAPARKRRRPNQDLQERLARCEDLLKQYASGSGPPQNEQSPIGTVGHDSPMTDGLGPPRTPQDGQPRWKSAAKVLTDDGSTRLMDSHLFASVFDELQAMRSIIETDDPEETSVLGSEDLTPDHPVELFLGSDLTAFRADNIQPDPVHVFRMWQIFLERVNPIMKIIHAPSLQAHVLEAAGGLSKMPLNYQALMFSIFNMVAISLSESECTQMLNMPRETAIAKYVTATRHALMKHNYLRNYDMPTLQALLLYMFSLQGRTDRHALWILNGTIVRVAQKMGYHRDGAILGLSPFEAEMRRRIWWHIVLQDAKHTMISGLSSAMLPLHSDTQEPLNINDADMFPGSTEPLQPREGPTEMGFCLVGYRISKFLIDHENVQGSISLEAIMMGKVDDNIGGTSTEEARRLYKTLAQDLDDDLLEVERRYLDPAAGKVHIAALTIRPSVSRKLQQMLSPEQVQLDGYELKDPRDQLFKILLLHSEQGLEHYEVLEDCGFLWFLKMHFQLDVFAVLTGQTYRSPVGTLADRAWVCIEKFHKYHPELYDVGQKQFAAQGQIALKAWKVRENAFAQQGKVIDTPYFIQRLRESLECPSDSKSSARTSSTTPPATARGDAITQPHPVHQMDPFLGGYLDVSSLNWDMWGGDGGANMTNGGGVDVFGDNPSAAQIYAHDVLGTMPPGQPKTEGFY